MSVGVMKDYKLKQRDLRASHTLGLKLFIMNRERESYREDLMRVGVMRD